MLTSKLKIETPEDWYEKGQGKMIYYVDDLAKS
jgi:hypothetical protein